MLLPSINPNQVQSKRDNKKSTAEPVQRNYDVDVVVVIVIQTRKKYRMRCLRQSETCFSS